MCEPQPSTARPFKSCFPGSQPRLLRGDNQRPNLLASWKCVSPFNSSDPVLHNPHPGPHDTRSLLAIPISDATDNRTPSGATADGRTLVLVFSSLGWNGVVRAEWGATLREVGDESIAVAHALDTAQSWCAWLGLGLGLFYTAQSWSAVHP